jgi:hypothetical protein
MVPRRLNLIQRVRHQAVRVIHGELRVLDLTPRHRGEEPEPPMGLLHRCACVRGQSRCMQYSTSLQAPHERQITRAKALVSFKIGTHSDRPHARTNKIACPRQLLTLARRARAAPHDLLCMKLPRLLHQLLLVLVHVLLHRSVVVVVRVDPISEVC